MSDTDKALDEAIMTVARAKVAEALGGDVLARIVDEVAKQTPNADRYGMAKRDREATLLEIIVQEKVRAALERGVVKAIEEHSEQLEAALKDAIGRDVERFAMTIIDAFKAKDDWRASLNVYIERKSED